MNSVIAMALKNEGVTDEGIKRIQQVLWDNQLSIQWDRHRWEADMRARAEAARVAEAEEVKARCIPYTGMIVQCMASVSRPGTYYGGRCINKAKYARRDAHGTVMVVCGTHTKSRFTYAYTNRRGEPVAVVESTYQPPKEK